MQWLAVLAWILFLAMFYFMWQTYVQIMHWRKTALGSMPMVRPVSPARNKPSEKSDLMMFLKQQFADAEHFTDQQQATAAVVVADTANMAQVTATAPVAPAAPVAPVAPVPVSDHSTASIGGTLPLATGPAKQEFDDSGFKPLLPATVGAAASDVQFFDRGNSSFSFL